MGDSNPDRLRTTSTNVAYTKWDGIVYCPGVMNPRNWKPANAITYRTWKSGNSGLWGSVMRWARSTYGMNNCHQYTAAGTTQRQNFYDRAGKISAIFRPDVRALLADVYPWDAYFTGSGPIAANRELNFPHANNCSLLFADGHVEVLGRASWNYTEAGGSAVWYPGLLTGPRVGCFPFTAPCQ